MNLLILGANSDIAQSIAKIFAKKEHANLYLASRDMEVLTKGAQDLAIRYQVEAKPLYFDALDFASHAEFYKSLQPKPDGVVVAFGYLGDQKSAQEDFNESRKIMETNYLGAVSILEIIAADFAARNRGFIIGLCSVAGERGRQSNYIYGSAKGAFIVYLSGLRNRLYRNGVYVLTALLGFVRTKMVADLNLPVRLSARPDEVAEDVYRAFTKKSDRIYSKWFWKWIMKIIKLMAETLFKRTRL